MLFDVTQNIASPVLDGRFSILWQISIGQIILFGLSIIGFVSGFGALVATVRANNNDITDLKKKQHDTSDAIEELRKERHDETDKISRDLLQFRKETLSAHNTIHEAIADLKATVKNMHEDKS